MEAELWLDCAMASATCLKPCIIPFAQCETKDFSLSINLNLRPSSFWTNILHVQWTTYFIFRKQNYLGEKISISGKRRNFAEKKKFRFQFPWRALFKMADILLVEVESERARIISCFEHVSFWITVKTCPLLSDFSSQTWPRREKMRN